MENPIQQVISLLKEDKFDDAKSLFDCKRNKTFLVDGTGEIISIICSILVKKEDLSEYHYDVLDSFVNYFLHNGSPKEILLYLLEALEEYINLPVNSFILLSHVQKTLLQLPEKRGSTLNWVLTSLTSLLKHIDLPTAHNYEGEERKLLDLDTDVSNWKEVLRSICDFLKPFIEEVSLKSTLKEGSNQNEKFSLQKKILTTFIVSLMGMPIAYLDTHHEQGDAESQIRMSTEKLIQYLAMMVGNLYSLTEAEFDEELSPATLSYLLIGEILPVSLPLVFSPLYIFIVHLKFSIPLLSRSEDLIIHKGLLLSEGILLKLKDNQLLEDILDLSEVVKFPKCLFQVMIFCQTQEHRKKALQVFKIYISKLNRKCRCNLLSILLQNEVHSGAKSLIINLYKADLHQELKSQEELIFGGKSLHGFLKRAIFLQDEEKTDLLENNDVILTASNFLRYLFLTDKKEENKTRIWDLLGYISEKFVEPLKTGLDLTKAHYNLELKNLKNKNWNSVTEPSVSVGGQTLPPLTEENHREVCLAALTNLDLMQSVLARLEENISGMK